MSDTTTNKEQAMNAALNTIEINGVTYAQVSDATAVASQGDAVLVCGGKTGRAVLVGYTREPITVGEPYTLHNARMLIYWPSACGGLLGFAQDGPKAGTRLSRTVDEVSDAIAHQVMPLSAEVMTAIEEWEVYRG